MEIPQNAQQTAREVERVVEAVYHEVEQVYQEVRQARNSVGHASEDAYELKKLAIWEQPPVAVYQKVEQVAQEAVRVYQEVERVYQEMERAVSSARCASVDALSLQERLVREARLGTTSDTRAAPTPNPEP